jgi:hypothetical protein
VSPRNSPAQPPAKDAIEEKPRFDIYTMMLIIAFLAITVACFLLWFELKAYGPFPQWKTEGVAPVTSSLWPSDAGNRSTASLVQTWQA